MVIRDVTQLDTCLSSFRLSLMRRRQLCLLEKRTHPSRCSTALFNRFEDYLVHIHVKSWVSLHPIFCSFGQDCLLIRY
jgi:hypothetical protein